MPLGETTQEIMYRKPAYEAFEDVRKALSMTGKVQSADRNALFIEGTSRSGLQSIQLNVKIIPHGTMSTISVTGAGGDVRAIGAKNCVKRLIDTVNNLDNPNYRASRTGVKPLGVALTVISVVVIVLAAVVLSMSFTGGPLGGVALLGFGLLIYLIFARMRFGQE